MEAAVGYGRVILATSAAGLRAYRQVQTNVVEAPHPPRTVLMANFNIEPTAAPVQGTGDVRHLHGERMKSIHANGLAKGTA